MKMISNKEEIIQQLEKIIEKSSIINQYREHIPQIEIDLILSDIRDLYEMYFHLNQKADEKEALNNAYRRKENEVLREEIKTSEKHISTEPLKILKKEEPDIIKEQPQIAKEIKTNIPNLAFNTNQIVAEKFKDDTNSINDKIGLTKTDTSIASKINEHQLTDIRKGIGLNEKFLFIRELFKGEATQYETFVNKTNELTSQAETVEWMTSQKNNYQWDENSEAFIALSKVIERKFS